MEANLIMPGNYGPEEISNSYPCWPSDKLMWTNRNANLSIWVDTPGGSNEFQILSNQVLSSDSKYKVMVLMEPISLCPKTYDFVLNNENMFDMILSTYPDFGSHNPDKYRYYHGGARSFIRPDERMIYTKSKNISAIVSNKNSLLGHILRHNIKNHHHNNKMGLIDYLNPPMDKKVDGIRDYRFELVIENEDSPFFSEKPLDSMLCGCIPIYWSSYDTSYLDIFDKDGIITFSTPEEFFEMLLDGYFTENLYISKLDAVRNNLEVAKRFVSLGDILWEYGIKDLIRTK